MGEEVDYSGYDGPCGEIAVWEWHMEYLGSVVSKARSD
jgi:hypothetical protein